MKKKFFSILACVMMCVCCLAGCGPTKLSGGPALDDTVYGNGGVAVRKGDYVYFVNAYAGQTVAYGKNKYGKETLSAIYRTKLDKNGLVQTDEEGNLVQSEILAKQIVGFKHAGIYIFGDYMYYTTPKATKDKSGTEVADLVSFERIKLNSTDHDTLYTTSAPAGEDFKYHIYQSNDRVYIVVLNAGELVSVSCNLTGGKTTKKVLDTDVTSAVFASEDQVTNEFSTYAYYTKASTIEDDGIADYTLINKVKLDGSKEPENLKLTSETFTLNQVKNNRLYYTYDTILYSTNSAIDPNTNTYYSANNLTSYKILDDQVIGSTSTDLGLVALLSNNVVYFRAQNDYVNLFSSDKAVTLQYIAGNYVYYTIAEDSALYRKVINKSRTPEQAEAERTIAGEKVIDNFISSVSYTVGEGEGATTESATIFDYDQNYLFYFNKVEDTNEVYSYMHLFKIGAQDEEGKAYDKFIGVLDKKDTEEVKEETPV